MMRSRLGKFLLFSFLVSLSLITYSKSFDDYLIYQADVDGDGDTDYLLKIAPEEIEIPYDVMLKRDRSAQEYLLRNNGGTFSVELVSSISAPWVLVDGDIQGINYSNASLDELLIRIYGSNGQAFVISQSAPGQLAAGAVLQQASLSSGTIAAVADLDKDGFDDVLISGDNSFNTLSVGSASLQHGAVQNFSPKAWAGNDGASHASVNIEIPQELGPKPNLSLNYSSNAGNGPVGYGFNLSGVSKIHYCNPLADVDGTMATRAFEGRLCLDGQRLVKTSGTRLVHGATYMTEISNHSRITYQNNTSQNQYVMQTKGGVKFIFGHARKHDQNSSKTIEWYLTRVEDEFSNGYDYHYKYATQHQYLPLLERIDYGTQTINLAWEARFNKPDQNNGSKSTTYDDEYMGHKGGATTLIRDRLAGVTVNRNSTSIRSYSLAYGVNNNGQSQLEKVTVCGLASTCTASDFEWYEGESTFQTPQLLANLSNKAANQKAQYLDINGDGFVDIMYPTAAGNWKFRLGSSTGFGGEVDSGIAEGTGAFADYAVPIKAGLDHIQGLIIADQAYRDTDSDGVYDELNKMLSCVKDNDFHVYLSSSEVDWTTENCDEVSGGGKLQYINPVQWYMLHANFSNGVFTGFQKSELIQTAGNRLYPSDVNKDGHQDIVVKWEYGFVDALYRDNQLDNAEGELLVVLIADADSSGSTTSHVEYTGFTVKSPQISNDFDGALSVSDFNRDGILDIEKCSDISLSRNCVRYDLEFDEVKYQQQRACNDNPGCDEEYDAITAVESGGLRPSTTMTKAVSYFDNGVGQTINKSLWAPIFYGDFNGDGEQDRLESLTTGLKASFGYGDGQEYVASNTPVITGDPFKTRLVDYNGDGLIDVLAESGGSIKLYKASRAYDAGKRYGRSIRYIEETIFDSTAIGLSSYSSTIIDEMFATTEFINSQIGHISLRQLPTIQYRDAPTPMDYDGDGVVDLLYFDGNNLYATKRSSSYASIRKLRKVIDAFGNNTEFTYENSRLEPNTDFDNIRFPYVNIANTAGVVSSIKFGSTQTGYRTKTYDYKGAQYHLQGRGFMGYSERTEIDTDKGLTVAEKYNVKFPLTGTLVSAQQYKGANEFVSKVTNAWFARALTDFDSQIKMPYLSSSTSEKYNLGTTRYGYIQTSSTYDDFGNTLNQTQYYKKNTSTVVKTQTVTNEYLHLDSSGNTIASELGRWRVGFADRSTVVSTANGDTKTQITELTPKGTTNLVETKTDFVGDEQELVHTYAYDNSTGVLLNEHLASGDDALHSIESRTQYSNSNFFSDYLPERITNPTGHSATISYDNLWHKPSRQTDVYGLATENTYDNWGAPYKSVSPEGVVSLSLTNLCVTGCPAGAYYYSTQLQMHKTQKGYLAPPQYTYYDKLGRVIREETLNANGQKVFQDYQYDLYSRLIAASLPYIDGQTAQWVQTSFDDLDRVLTTTYADGGSVVNSYSATTAGLNVNRYVYNKMDGTALSTETTTTRYDVLGQIYELQNLSSGLKNTYTYDGLGNLKSATISEGANTRKQVVAEYNTAGLKTQISDPDTGVYHYEYDSLGLMRKQTDARNHVYSFIYDKLNNQVQRTLNGNTDATWIYSSTKPGLLVEKYKQNFLESYEYDNFLRPVQVNTQLKDQAQRQFKYEYDAVGRNEKTHYPSGFSIEAAYNSLGYLTGYKKPKSDQYYWQAETMDAFGNWVGERLGNDIQTTREYDPASGLLQRIQSKKSQDGDIQDLSYTWDTNGNLRSRRQVMGASTVTETFGYDATNRLTSAVSSGLSSGTRALNYAYDALGNMTTKSDLSDVDGMAYGLSNYGPSRLVSVTKDGAQLHSYSYDASGNMTRRGSTNLQYTAANKPSSISEIKQFVSYTKRFEYDTEEQRFYQNQQVGYQTTRETYYYGTGYEEIYDTDPQTQIKTHKQKAYVAGVMIHTVTQSEVLIGKVSDIQYLHHDHQGSTQAITNANGNILKTLAFDPYGRARQSNWEDIDTTNGNPDWAAITLDHTSTGYTGHEMLGEFELIHMGGRIYDPVAGRMMSADPFIQAPLNGQSYNRYSYVWDNPMSNTDPTGYEMISIAGLTGQHDISFTGSWNNTSSVGGAGTGNSGGFVHDGTIGKYPTWKAEAPNLNESGNITNNSTMTVGSGGGGSNIVGSSSTYDPSDYVHEPYVPIVSNASKLLDKISQAPIYNFIMDEGASVVARSAQIIGGLGQIAGGGLICAGSGLFACAGGGLIAAKGVDNIYSAYLNQPTQVSNGITALTGSRDAGELGSLVLDFGTTGYLLIKPVARKHDFDSTIPDFMNFDSQNHEPAFRQKTRKALYLELGVSVSSMQHTLNSIKGQEESN